MTFNDLAELHCLRAPYSGVPNGRPYFVDMQGVRSLHFDTMTLQSQMWLANPEALELDYTRAMMGFMLFAEAPRTIEMIGLGGGSLAKYCHRRLPAAKITVVEISADIIGLREAFGVPPDDVRFRVVHADGAEYVRDHRRSTDILLVDGFDLGGQPPPSCVRATSTITVMHV